MYKFGSQHYIIHVHADFIISHWTTAKFTDDDVMTDN